MHELSTSARLVEYEALGDSMTTVLSRRDLEDALGADERARLWFELGREGDAEVTRLTVDLEPDELVEILRLSTGDEVALALDGETLETLVSDPDVEAHGLRGALAVAVTSAAILAPAGLAATPQTADAAASAQRAQAAASTTQRARLAANPQVASLATRTQIAPQKAKAAKKAQVSTAKASALKLLRSGILR